MEWDCKRRLAASDTVFWLADPLYIVEGNDRRIISLDRGLQDRFYREMQDARPGGRSGEQTRRSVRASLVRRGPPDSFRYLPRTQTYGVSQLLWTSKKAALYHFVPDFEGEGFGNPTWRLTGDLDDEGYTPSYGAFYPLPVQIARFRATDAAGKMRVATAGSVTASPIEQAAESGYLVFTDAPESFPLQLQAPFHEGRAVYLAEADFKSWVASFEVLTSAGIGWHREMVPPLQAEGPGLSDLLLYRPTGLEEPDSLLAAAGVMLPDTDLDGGGEVGVYWELYGADDQTPVEYEVAVEKEKGGLIDRLRRLLPGGPEEGEGRITWTEPARGPASPRAVNLDLQALDPGTYTLVARAQWPGQEVLETRRTVEIR